MFVFWFLYAYEIMKLITPRNIAAHSYQLLYVYICASCIRNIRNVCLPTTAFGNRPGLKKRRGKNKRYLNVEKRSSTRDRRDGGDGVFPSVSDL